MSAGTTMLGGRYRLLDVLGAGGMAVVHRARDELLQRDVAVKILRHQFTTDEDFVHRFRQEARNAASLSHSSIATVFDTGAEGDIEYIVMQLVEGSDLERVIAQRGRLPVAEALGIATDVAEALQAAHDHGIVHRDVKPGNILLTADGQVRVVDFGIARALGATNTTLPGLVLGSVPYLSPEQVLGEPVGSASDVYSLGVVLYELLTGRRPFEGPSQASVALARLHAAPRPPSEVVGDLPDGIDELVIRALERDPDRRYATAGGLATAIRGWTKAHPGGTRGPVRRARATADVPAAAAAAVVAAAVAAPTPAAATMAAATSAPTVASTVRDASRRGRPRGAPVAADSVTVRQPAPVASSEPAGAPPPGARTTRRDGDDRRRRAGFVWLLPLAALLIAVVALSAMGRSLFGGGGTVAGITASPVAPASAAAVIDVTPSPTPVPTASPTPTPTAAPTPTPTARSAPARTAAPTPRPTTAPRPLPARDPAETVASFYDLVEAHEFDAAAKLWTARMRRQYPPKGYIDGRFSRTTRIDLQKNRIVVLNRRAGTAVVSVDLIEYRTVEPSPRRFIGSWDLVLVNGQWLMDRPHF